MSFSIDSVASTISSSASSVTASMESFNDKSPKKKWHKWSDAFCVGVEERFACGDEVWKEEDDDDDDDDDDESLLHDSESTIEAKKEKKPFLDTKKIEDSLKSHSFFASYHKAKTSSKVVDTSVRKKEEEKAILNQFVQGNHRGWGPVRPASTKTRRTSKNDQEILKENLLLSDGSTFDDTLDEGQMRELSLTDSNTSDDTFDEGTLEYTSTFESTYDGTYDGTVDGTVDDTYDSTYPDDDEANYEDESFPSTKPSPSLRIVGCDDNRSSSSSSSFSSDQDRSGRDDSVRYSLRKSKIQQPTLERDSPSFGSHRSKGPSIDGGRSSGNSNSKGSSFVTPKKMLSSYQSSPLLSSNKVSVFVATKESMVPSDESSQEETTTRGYHKKKIALGRRRATERMIKEQAKSKPKAFPYLVNHSLFHQNLDKKKARALGTRHRTGE